MVASGAQRSLSEGDICSARSESPRLGTTCSDQQESQLDSVRRRFQLGRRLGRGTYGSVRLAKDRSSGRLVALKSVYKRNVRSQNDLQRVRKEAEIMRSLDHPNILKVLDVLETRSRLVLVLEYAAGGELFDRLVCDPSHQESLADEEKDWAEKRKRWFCQLASAVHHCHERDIAHRDLKLENILLDEEGNVKLGDFGLATHFSSSQRLSTYCGSALYASPEVINARPYIGPEVDCWSLGVVLFTLVHGCMPFGGEARQLISQVSTGSYCEPRHVPGASDVIASLLQPLPETRASASDVINSKWLRELDTLQADALSSPSKAAKSCPCVQNSNTSDSGVDIDSSRPSSLSSQCSLSDCEYVTSCDEVDDAVFSQRRQENSLPVTLFAQATAV